MSNTFATHCLLRRTLILGDAFLCNPINVNILLIYILCLQDKHKSKDADNTEVESSHSKKQNTKVDEITQDAEDDKDNEDDDAGESDDENDE